MKLDIAFLVAGMPFDGSTLTTKSLGGSESAGAYVARELARRGHRVKVFSRCGSQAMHDGVHYLPAEAFQAFAIGTPQDVCVVQRMPEMFANRTCARLNLLWCHDLALKRQKQTFGGMLWNIDKVLVVSQFMADQYREVYGVDAKELHVARNGIDLAMFHVKQALERDDNLIIYTARPERGLDVLLEKIFPRLLEMRPDTKLAIAGYDNQVDHMRPLYQRMNELMTSFRGKVEWLGHLAKPELYDLYRRGALYVYPTPSLFMPDFCEVSCITMMECMAAGLPVVTTNRGALPDTLAKGAGLMLELPSNGMLWPDQACDIFAGEVANLLGDRSRRDWMGELGREAAKAHSWADIAAEWEDLMLRLIDERNDDPVRLAYHFMRRSDIIAAHAALDFAEAKDREAELRAELEAHWPFALDPSKLAERLEAGDNYTDTFELDGQSRRFQELIKWLEPRKNAIKTILDVGCGLGSQAVHLSNRFPHLQITGIDMDPKAITWADEVREQHAKDPSRIAFIAGTDADLPEGPFDLVLCTEVLEHVHEPWALIERIQARAKRGGWIYLTTPWGPWEHMSYRTMPARSHLWEFDFHDIHDMLEGQAELVIDSMPIGQSTLTNEVCGNLFVSWRVSDYQIGKIDMARKLRLQRPRQTVSASLMCGGDSVENHLHACIRSLRDVVDEIVIADTGMSEEARRIAEQYNPRIIPSPTPFEIGFEGPRNIALDHCRMDWVLWIDADEELVDQAKLDKYFRENTFAGYSLCQHHWSIDHPITPDMPVRLYRRRAMPDGRRLRHWGMIHEHPEIAVNEGPGKVIAIADVAISHPGYLCETIRRERFRRNLPMLKRDIEVYPDRILQKHFICRDNMLQVGHELSRNGNQITPAIKEICQEVVDLYRKHFLGNQIYANVDTLPYYSQACKVLGLGLDVEFTIRANRDGVGQKLNGDHHRFASVEDALLEMTGRAKAAMAELDTGRYW
jgi:glycosyltransferase involved in cell wall biosynthesis/SAM-dependent methyltransferase